MKQKLFSKNDLDRWSVFLKNNQGQLLVSTVTSNVSGKIYFQNKKFVLETKDYKKAFTSIEKALIYLTRDWKPFYTSTGKRFYVEEKKDLTIYLLL